MQVRSIRIIGEDVGVVPGGICIATSAGRMSGYGGSRLEGSIARSEDVVINPAYGAVQLRMKNKVSRWQL